MRSMSRFIALAALGLVPLAASAEIYEPRFELFSGASLLKLTGTTTTSFGSTYDLDRDLHLDAGAQYQLDLHYAPARGWWPDVAFAYAHLNGDGSGIANTPTSFGGVTLASGSALLSHIAFNDYSASFEAPLGWLGFTIEPGLTIKYLQGTIDVSNTDTQVLGGVVTVNGLRSTQRVSRVFPLVHLRLARDLASWLRVSAGGNFIRYGSDEVYEYGVRADTHLAAGIGASIGYQRRHYRVAETLYRTNADLGGVYFGLSLDTGG